MLRCTDPADDAVPASDRDPELADRHLAWRIMTAIVLSPSVRPAKKNIGSFAGGDAARPSAIDRMLCKNT